MSPDLGVFTPMFASHEGEVPAYLELLNLGSAEGVRAALRRLRDALREADDPSRALEPLFSGFNWRPHLVGAVASLLVPDPRPVVPHLWRAVDTASWVAPQLCTALWFVDPGFVAAAGVRVLSAGGHPPSDKATASLLALLRRDPTQAAWIAEAERRPDVRDRLERDRSSARIAEGWRAGLVEIAEGEVGVLPGIARRGRSDT